MENRNAKVKVVVSLAALAGLLGFSLFAIAGNLEPSAAPGPTMHTLEEVYSAITQPSEGNISLPHHSDVEGSSVIHMTVTGESQGEIHGSVTAAGKENSILLTRFVHEIFQPLAEGTGLPTGFIQHKPITITKEIDKSSPQLYNAFLAYERLTVMFKFYRTGPGDVEELYYTIELRDANVADFKWDRGPEQMQYKDREHITLCYQRIEWSWVLDGGFSAYDTWIPITP